MKRFLFRLEPVLALRAARQNEAAEKYARAVDAVTRSERDLLEAKGDLERLHQALQSARGGRFNRNDQIISLNAISYQQAICERTEERLNHLRREAEGRLQELLAARRAHEVLLRLRAKQRSQHQRETEQREQVAVDDLVMTRFVAKSRRAAA